MIQTGVVNVRATSNRRETFFFFLNNIAVFSPLANETERAKRIKPSPRLTAGNFPKRLFERRRKINKKIPTRTRSAGVTVAQLTTQTIK